VKTVKRVKRAKRVKRVKVVKRIKVKAKGPLLLLPTAKIRRVRGVARIGGDPKRQRARETRTKVGLGLRGRARAIPRAKRGEMDPQAKVPQAKVPGVNQEEKKTSGTFACGSLSPLFALGILAEG